jgi:hypothetical protein
MSRTKEEIQFWCFVASGVGGIACVLSLFGVRLGDGMSLPHLPPNIGWLIGSILLYALNLYGVFYYRKSARIANAIRAAEILALRKQCKEQVEALLAAQTRHAETVIENESLKSDPKRLLGAVIDAHHKVEAVGVLREYAKQADRLYELLEKIWHLHNSEKNGRSLEYPLAKSEVPDEIKEWHHKQLCMFRAFYHAHIEAVKAIAPDLHTNLIDSGFPRDSPYLEVRKDLQCHAGFLRDQADRQMKAFLGAKVEI